VLAFGILVIWGISEWRDFFIGAVIGTLWFPIGTGLLDWGIGGGASPAHFDFYLAIMKHFFYREYLSYTLLPALAVLLVDIMAFCLSLLVRKRLVTSGQS
jgi:hypothetical protein